MENFDRWVLRLDHQRVESDSVVTFAFEPTPPLKFRAGQWLHLACVTDPTDRSQVRHMSLASAPQDDLLEFTMDLASGSAYKRTLSGLKAGDRVAAFKLRGDFTVEDSETRPLCFLAGGLGITPIRSILKDLAARGSTLPRRLIHVARGPHLFAQELSSLALDQTRTDHAGWDALKSDLVREASRRSLFYVCGSQGFLDGIRSDLTDAGVSLDRIKAEDFH